MAINLPPKLQSVYDTPSRMKLIYGGRGGGKSHGVASILLVLGMTSQKRILCAREFQSSLKDSVHRLLVDIIMQHDVLMNFYQVQQDQIMGRNGTIFRFAGLKNNINAIRSFEGVDVVWIEEGANVSKQSMDILIPTIRKTGSEIWLTMNPDLETDYIYKRYILNTVTSDDPLKNEMVIKMNWHDNDWFPDVLFAEMEKLRDQDYKQYLHIWEGEPRSTLEGAIYSKELEETDRDGRICDVPYTPGKPVHCFYDLGYRDSTAIVMAQKVGPYFHVIDFYENNQQTIEHYLLHLQDKKYVWGTDYLPHDGDRKWLGSDLTIEKIIRNAGRKVKVLPALSVVTGINAARTIFPLTRFDRTKTIDLIQALRKYRYIDGKEKPLHDHWSHASDAFRYFAMAMTDDKPVERARDYFEPAMGSWQDL